MLSVTSPTRPVLASASRTRIAMLENAGIEIDTDAAELDEDAIIKSLTQTADPLSAEDVALVLAQAKAQHVAERHPGRLVIGCDQTLGLGDELFTKPANMDEARRNLLKLSGKTHFLHSAVAICASGETDWTFCDTARMKMRDLSPQFIGRYLAQAGGGVLSSVGVYQLEGLGAQLFDEVDGDFFTILGLPLLPLLAELRARQVIGS